MSRNVFAPLKRPAGPPQPLTGRVHGWKCRSGTITVPIYLYRDLMRTAPCLSKWQGAVSTLFMPPSHHRDHGRPRMFLVTFLVLDPADSQRQLHDNASQASSIAQKYNCQLTPLPPATAPQWCGGQRNGTSTEGSGPPGSETAVSPLKPAGR